MIINNRKLFMVIGVLLVFILGGIIIFNFFPQETNIETSFAVLTYKYSDKNICVNLSNEDSQILKAIFNNKKLYSDNPSCGFTPNISIRFGDDVFSIACDNCPIIRLDNKNKYLKVSSEERETINKIFDKFGAKFPCL